MDISPELEELPGIALTQEAYSAAITHSKDLDIAIDQAEVFNRSISDGDVPLISSAKFVSFWTLGRVLQ